MATVEICCVRDRAIDSFGNPFAVVALGQATRSFSDEVRNPESQISRHPDDYDLYHVGSFDTSTGKLVPRETPEMIAIGKSIADASVPS